MDILLNPSVVGFIVFLGLLLLNMPIFASLGLAALFTLVVFDAAPLAVVPYVLGGSLDKFPLLATPLFIIAGAMITRSGMSRRIVNLAQVVLGQLPGGLALATLLTGAIISSMSGSNIATVAALSFLIPAMAEVGYPKTFAVAVVYIFVIDQFIYRRIGLANYPQMLYDSGKTIGVVALIIARSSVFAWIWQTQGIANVITTNLLDWSGGHPTIILLLINVLLVLCGAFLEPIAAMYLLVPLVKPTLVAANIDLIHFGAMMTVNLSMAHLTPPVGVGLFLAAKVGGVPFETAAKWAIPFVLCEIVVILLVTYFPSISLFLAQTI